MASKKRVVKKKPAQHVQEEPPMVLTPETLADLHFIEPPRARERVISMLNEIYVFVLQLRQQHQPPEH